MSAAPSQPPRFDNPPGYEFPSQRLGTLRDARRTPLVLVACGSFSPVTYLHLRMFEMAVDFVRQNTEFEVVGGYLSPVSDKYRKPGLLSAEHRYAPCLCRCRRDLMILRPRIGRTCVRSQRSARRTGS
jgi:nicotinamide mononucleotide adenylyltransferase